MTFGFPEILGVRLPPPLRARYKSTRDRHRDGPTTRVCAICLLHRCPEYRWATRQLILSGEPLSRRTTPAPQPRLSAENAG